MKKKHKKKIFFLFLCYAAALSLWLMMSAFYLARDSWSIRQGKMQHQQLQPQDFYATNGIHFSKDWENDSYFATADSDPQLILSFDKSRPVGLFIFEAQAVNKPPGEIVLYYTTRKDQPFSERHKVWAREGNPNQWYFDLKGRSVYGLRLDPDTVGGVFWQVSALDLNAPKNISFYFIPDALESWILLFAPILAWGTLSETIAFFHPIYARKKLESRW